MIDSVPLKPVGRPNASDTLTAAGAGGRWVAGTSMDGSDAPSFSLDEGASESQVVALVGAGPVVGEVDETRRDSQQAGPRSLDPARERRVDGAAPDAPSDLGPISHQAEHRQSPVRLQSGSAMPSADETLAPQEVASLTTVSQREAVASELQSKIEPPHAVVPPASLDDAARRTARRRLSDAGAANDAVTAPQRTKDLRHQTVDIAAPPSKPREAGEAAVVAERVGIGGGAPTASSPSAAAEGTPAPAVVGPVFISERRPVVEDQTKRSLADGDGRRPARYEVPTESPKVPAAERSAFAKPLVSASLSTERAWPEAPPPSESADGDRVPAAPPQRDRQEASERAPTTPIASQSIAVAPAGTAVAAYARPTAGESQQVDELTVDDNGPASRADLGPASAPSPGGGAGASAPAVVGSATPLTRPVAEDAAVRIASAASDARGGAVELRLDPPELGGVRVSLSTAEGAAQALVVAERPETADLLRRHADLLARELAAAGHGRVEVEVSTGGRQGASGGNARWTPPGAEVQADVVVETQGAARVVGGGLDLRV